jgi:hypothetical protein
MKEGDGINHWELPTEIKELVGETDGTIGVNLKSIHTGTSRDVSVKWEAALEPSVRSGSRGDNFCMQNFGCTNRCYVLECLTKVHVWYYYRANSRDSEAQTLSKPQAYDNVIDDVRQFRH